MNMRRLNVSAERLSLPTFDAASAVQLLARFASYEERFVPQ
jgi:branched-subunit amino acid aminotransferase/4-amino-4-deoxychorismate lyase